ncbi:MAG TPA: glycogen debranching protein GlgX [Thermomicrobiales bacterium]|nr:glycogen debranching protein GlgX [Thermomicrobiales bacterium]
MTEPAHDRAVRPGSPAPLGATLAGSGANFAVYSEHATSVAVCLFEDGEGQPSRTVSLTERTNFVWHGWIDGVRAGTPYGLRVDGEYHAEQGMRFNPAKLLVDPYARSIAGEVAWNPTLYSYSQDDPEADQAMDPTPNDAFVPKALVIDTSFDWGDDRRPGTPLEQSVIYEAHVKGLTMLHPDVPEGERGTYLGAAHPSVISHLQHIGATAIEFLPVHAHVSEPFIASRGLTNYWGYNTLGYFAPHARYATKNCGNEVVEFKQMVKAFHATGIEVLLDVVYNHTCEGNHLGPTLSFKGIDNTTYYNLLPGKPEYYLDLTGTGNSLQAAHPQVLKLMLDSLRYWVEEMRVDGFRFDLASTLGREQFDFDPRSGFFDAIHQDPVISQVKLIAEPWDVGEGGYQVGRFPVIWSEWNDKFRDATRSFWNANSKGLAEMGYRLTGSSDIYEVSGRGPRASVNLVTAHDGFTLNDLVSYAEKHNEANGENGLDGHSHNISANYGVEGETDDPEVLGLRRRQQRNMLATLFLSQGVPMLLGGDEFNRTQGGNNNAYCQDNEISWFDWNHDDAAKDMIRFVRRLTRIRRDFPLLRRRRFFRGRPNNPDGFKDISWVRPDGKDMTDTDWSAGASSIGLRMAGDEIEEPDVEGGVITTPSLMLIIHAGPEPVKFRLPNIDRSDIEHTWELILDTDHARGEATERYAEGSEVEIPGRSVWLLQGSPDLP